MGKHILKGTNLVPLLLVIANYNVIDELYL